MLIILVSFVPHSNANGTCTAKPEPLGCTCVVWGRTCKEWASGVYPTEVPSDSEVRSNMTIDGTVVDEYSWQAGIVGSVLAYVAKGKGKSPRPLVRFVASRVQSDYKFVHEGRPDAKYFAVPSVCKAASAAFTRNDH